MNNARIKNGQVILNNYKIDIDDEYKTLEPLFDVKADKHLSTEVTIFDRKATLKLTFKLGNSYLGGVLSKIEFIFNDEIALDLAANFDNTNYYKIDNIYYIYQKSLCIKPSKNKTTIIIKKMSKREYDKIKNILERTQNIFQIKADEQYHKYNFMKKSLYNFITNGDFQGFAPSQYVLIEKKKKEVILAKEFYDKTAEENYKGMVNYIINMYGTPIYNDNYTYCWLIDECCLSIKFSNTIDIIISNI